MIEIRSHHALMVAEDRMRDLRREADLRRRFEGVRRQPAPVREDRRRWRVADFVGLLVPKRAVKPRNATTSPKPL